jgi:small subunit ribosomal protein S20
LALIPLRYSRQSPDALVQFARLVTQEINKTGDLLLANHKSALKRIRSSEKKRQRNRIFRSKARTEVKKARASMDQGDLQTARAATLEAIRTLDKAAVKGIVHPNNAARRKSRLMKRLAELEAQAK